MTSESTPTPAATPDGPFSVGAPVLIANRRTAQLDSYGTVAGAPYLEGEGRYRCYWIPVSMEEDDVTTAFPVHRVTFMGIPR